MRQRALLAITLSVALSPSAIVSQTRVPNLTLRVAVRQKEDGRLGKEVHILTLQCVAGDCWLTSVSLNQCGQSALGTPAFPVVVEMSSTRDGRLRVTNLGDKLEVEELATDIGGEASNAFLFGYELSSDGSVAGLTSFSGGFVKHSAVLNKVITVEYVPFRRLMQAIKLDCPVLVPGVDLSDFDDLIESLPASDQAVWQRLAKDPDRPLLTDERRARRLFPDYDKMKAAGTQFSADQWRRYVGAYLDEQDAWLKAGGVSATSRQVIRRFQSEALLEQLKKH